MPASMESLGFSKLCHNIAPFDDRTTRLPLLRSLAEEFLLTDVFAAIQRMWPSVPDSTRTELLAVESFADEAWVIGLSRLTTHTTVHWGILLNHMPTYIISVEFEGEKKPKAKVP
uniref:Uncharacterized protein n=1 Tax=Oryza punctata TaxID=4537 RepID=A0A0E0MLQ7_ORYPU